jgi:hypothetical protein
MPSLHTLVLYISVIAYVMLLEICSNFFYGAAVILRRLPVIMFVFLAALIVIWS